MLFFMRVKLKNEKHFITLFLPNLQLFQHVPMLNMYSLILVETTNDRFFDYP